MEHLTKHPAIVEVEQAQSRLEGFEEALSDAHEALRSAEDAVTLWEGVSHELRVLSEAIQYSVYGKIEDTVTHALRFIFETDYKCRLVTDQKRGRVEASIIIERDGIRLNPLKDCGGGVVDVVSFALRLVAITSDSSRSSRRLLVLDEPMKYLSAEYRPRAAQLIMDLSNKLDFQFIIVTHDDAFTLGKEIRL